MLFGDDLIDSKVPCLKQMVKVFERYGDPVIALEEVDKKEVSSYGVVAAIPIDNKIYPVRNNPPKPFGRVSAGAISNMVYGYRFDGKRYDCGSKIGFLKAIVDFGLKHKETKKEFRKYLKQKFS